MTESEYIEVSNLARIRAAYRVLNDMIPDYGPVSQERLRAITSPLSDLLDDCFKSMHGRTSGEKEKS